MTEIVVHVTTLEQWKSVLDVWFKQGYEWFSSGNTYAEKTFEHGGANQLGLVDYGFKYIVCWINNDYDGGNLIEYKQFMAQQKEDKKIETYYVTQEQLDLMNTLHEELYSLDELLNCHTEAKAMFRDLSILEGSAVLRYLGGDDTIEFKVNEQLYRLWRIDNDKDRVYMRFTPTSGNPSWTLYKDDAFTAPLEEIKKHKTISWEIEDVK